MYWDRIYRVIDGKGSYRDEIGGLADLGGNEYRTNELYPVLDELKDLGIDGLQIELRMHHAQGLRDNKVLDLRKLKSLRLQHQVDLPFTDMHNLNFAFAQVGLRLGGGNFLDGLRDVRPYHVNASAP